MEKIKITDMKKLVFLIAVPMLALAMWSAKGQTDGGALVYSLPSTSLHLAVEAEREVYTPGPYAKYAKKYLEKLEEEKEFKIVRTKRFATKPMSPEEAILQMNLLGHQFFVFFTFFFHNIMLFLTHCTADNISSAE